MNSNHKKLLQVLKTTTSLLLTFTFLLPVMVKAAPLDLATIPLANSPTVAIQPNLLFIMDDSGSMGWDYMPDWANTNDTFEMDASFNTIYYNPAIRYIPPANFTSSGLDTATYPSQTGLNTATGASYAGKPNWQNVKRDPYMSTSTTNLEGLNGGDGPKFLGDYCNRIL